MIRVLSMIALAGFFLSVVCLAAAVALGGPDLLTSTAWDWTGHSVRYHWVGDRAVIADTPDRGGADEATRELAWTGGDTLQVDVPVDVTVTETAGPGKIVIHGPSEAVDHVAFHGGELTWTGQSEDADELRVEIQAPGITQFTVNSSGKLEIHGVKTDEIAIRVNGSGDVSADGVAKVARLEVMSSADADLSGLQSDGADVRMAGSGHASVNPKSWAKLQVTGSGDVKLGSKPARLDTQVTGSGRVEMPG